MKNGITNILIVGVGGQGVLLASEILTEVAKYNGFDAKKSEVHGMSQRGGIVSSHVRFGEKSFRRLFQRAKPMLFSRLKLLKDFAGPINVKLTA